MKKLFFLLFLAISINLIARDPIIFKTSLSILNEDKSKEYLINYFSDLGYIKQSEDILINSAGKRIIFKYEKCPNAVDQCIIIYIEDASLVKIFFDDRLNSINQNTNMNLGTPRDFMIYDDIESVIKITKN